MQSQVFQLELLYLAAPCHGEFFYEEYVFGNLVPGDFPNAEVAYIRLVQVCSFVLDDECADRLAVLFGGNTGYLHVFYAFQLLEELFDFARIDILPAAYNHILDASGDAVVAVFVFYTQVAGV